MILEAGKRRERVTIQTKNLVDNGRGGRKRPDGEPEWIDKSTVWAEVIPLRGNEALSNSILRSVQIYRVTIRFRADVTTANQLMWGTVAMDIKAAARSVDRADLVMTCESGMPA